jgi:predicted MFS family arabinose efflux permease
VGLRAYGAPGAVADAGRDRGLNPFVATARGLALGAQSRTFWLLATSFFICGATTTGLIGTHLIPAARDHGMDTVTAATILAGMGVFDIVGTTVAGYLTDRYDSRWLLFWYYGLRGVALLALPTALGSPALGIVLFMVVYGLDWVATVPPTVALTARTFGAEHVGIVFGWVFAAHQLGAAVAAGAAGGIRDWLGDYTMAFVGGAALCFLASLLVIRISTDSRPRGVVLAPTGGL